MRLWSLNPKYLDTKGLVALWREGLLAKHVLEGKTKGYKNHPQLNRFKRSKRPVENINRYLAEVYQEAVVRKYNFNREKINWDFKRSKLTVTKKQLEYETKHLLSKLRKRDTGKYKELKRIKIFETHPLFRIIEGEIGDWEILDTK